MANNGLAMSASKADVMARLGLTGADGEQIYRRMLNEAASVRDRVSNNPDNLNPQLMDKQLPAPYRWDQLSETARHREVLNIAEYASPATKRYFQMGRWASNVETENWVAKWFLWHCFRYRDNRPQNGGSHHPPQAG